MQRGEAALDDQVATISAFPKAVVRYRPPADVGPRARNPEDDAVRLLHFGIPSGVGHGFGVWEYGTRTTDGLLLRQCASARGVDTGPQFRLRVGRKHGTGFT